MVLLIFINLLLTVIPLYLYIIYPIYAFTSWFLLKASQAATLISFKKNIHYYTFLVCIDCINSRLK